jgi:uncharacterized protein (TIGR00269 family)
VKCRKCERPAVINMRRHRLALCQFHFPPWFVQRTLQTIEKYNMFTPRSRVLVAVSGGKDSLALWDVLLELNYAADGLTIDLGIDDYSTASREKVEKYAATRQGARLIVVNLHKEYGETLPEVAQRVHRGRRKTCSVCGLVKRHLMNRVARQEGYDVLVTGHNLDDEVATLFGNLMHWKTGYLVRQAPVLPSRAGGLARKAKPFCHMYERETAAYASMRGIDYIYDECPFAAGATSLRYKAIWNLLEEQSAGAKMQFYLGFLRAKGEEFFNELSQAATLTPCTRCGQPTSAPGLCAFCRLWKSDCP